MIEQLIQLAGIVMVVALAALMVVPALRIPAFLVGILSIPGNVDNLLPQMQLDFHALPDNTGPAVSFVDGLLLWALILTLREGRKAPDSRLFRSLVVLSVIVVVVGSLAAFSAVATLGADPLAAVRGILIFVKIPIILYLVAALLDTDPTGSRLSVAAAIGAVALLANGLYVSIVGNLARLTAATFGRNGLGMVLALITVIAAASSATRWRNGDRIGGVSLAIVSGASLVGAMFTGTRMSLVAVALSTVAALAFNVDWRTWRGAARVAAVCAAAAAVIAVSTLTSAAGARTVSVVTNVRPIIVTVANLEGESVDSEVVSREMFWGQAATMARDHPLTGVGPFQWNVRRYALDANAPVLVAGPHNAYFQIAAESGVPTLLVYLVLLGTTMLAILRAVWRGATVIRHHWAASAIAACAMVYPITEITNSHLFNTRLGPFGWILLATAAAMSLAASSASSGNPQSS